MSTTEITYDREAHIRDLTLGAIATNVVHALSACADLKRMAGSLRDDAECIEKSGANWPNSEASRLRVRMLRALADVLDPKEAQPQ